MYLDRVLALAIVFLSPADKPLGGEQELAKLAATLAKQQEQIEALQKQVAKLAQELQQLKESHKELIGKWTLVAVEENGKREAPEQLVRWEFGINKVTIWRDEKAGLTMSYKLRPFEVLKEIDLKWKEDDKPILGIYLLDGDQLSICYSTTGGPRPDAIRSVGDARVWIFKKEK